MTPQSSVRCLSFIQQNKQQLSDAVALSSMIESILEAVFLTANL